MRDSAPALAHGRIVASGFRPHPLLRGSHAQTVFPALLRPLPPLLLRRERLELADGDFLELGWSGPPRGPLALLVHGLGGGLESKYARGTALQLHARGWRTVALQMRGAGEEPNRLPRGYNHGDTADLLYLCRLLREREADGPLVAVGWSMGANILLKALGETGDNMPLTAAVAACAPFQLQACVERLGRGFSRIYQDHLLKGLKQSAHRKHGPVALPAGADLRAALAAADFFAFDDAYTAPMNGYADARDYYRRASCGQFLAGIRRPTLIVNAIDDPFMVPSIIPAERELAAAVTLELSPQGGHVGFVAADRGGRPLYWLEQRIAEHLSATCPAPGLC
ncbi:MAG: hydrolase [Nevskia sp.]|nr:hydrolase [Nevskia sp.]